MFVESSWKHKNWKAPGYGEYIELTLWVGTDIGAGKDSFVNWSGDEGRILPEDRWEPLEKGVFSALAEHEHPPLKVALVSHGWMDVGSPPSLFEWAGKTWTNELLEELSEQLAQ
ncbi:MAG: hypothetical protein MK180_18000 [Rhodobacteraceae bacterium]|nr:hypothetical protein [Paracoccaceae bacterium]